MSMKIEIGKKYLMRNYPAYYDYVVINRIECNYFNEIECWGHIIVNGKPDIDLLSNEVEEYRWSENGSWDLCDKAGLGQDINDLIIEL